jgi:hypothetical protein
MLETREVKPTGELAIKKQVREILRGQEEINKKYK